MRNCNARMTGGVHKPFHQHWWNWSVPPESLSVVATFLACVALFVGTESGLRALRKKCIRQQFATGFTCTAYYSKPRPRDGDGRARQH